MNTCHWMSRTSFVMECLAQWLRLPHHHQCIQVAGIGGAGAEHALHVVSLYSMISIINLKSFDAGKVSWPHWKVEAVVLLKITTKLPALPVPSNQKSKQLLGLHLANPGFKVCDYINVLFGVDVFSRVIHQGWQLGPLGLHLALETCFGWVSPRTIQPVNVCPQQQTNSYFSFLLTHNEMLQKF